MSVVFDSCVLIDHLVGREPARALIAESQGAAISLVTWMEVCVGARSPTEEALVRGFLAAFDVLPVDAPVAEEAVRLRRSRRLKLPDAIVLATARVHGRELLTRDALAFPADEPGVRVPYALD